MNTFSFEIKIIYPKNLKFLNYICICQKKTTAIGPLVRVLTSGVFDPWPARPGPKSGHFPILTTVCPGWHPAVRPKIRNFCPDWDMALPQLPGVLVRSMKLKAGRHDRLSTSWMFATDLVKGMRDQRKFLEEIYVFIFSNGFND